MSYWNFIIPPIIFFLSLFFLIKIFRKKKTERETVLQGRAPFGNFSSVSQKLSRLGPQLVGKSGGFLDLFEKKITSFFSILFRGVKFVFKVFLNIFFKKQKTTDNSMKKVFSRKELYGESKDLNREVKEGMSEKEMFLDRKKDEAMDVVKSEEDIVSRPMVSDMTKPSSSKKRVLSKNDYEEALIGRIALNPRDISAYESLGDFYIDQRNFEDALECYRQVIKLDPQHRGTKVRIRRLERVLAHDQFLH
ncbi:MAG: tetratricopeptide repeat protein [Candidatus Moraniibacteriota bacterium]|nr:MAG: tetratricopeptide repeat protein [Candidatus Moranbacteria bacterium]